MHGVVVLVVLLFEETGLDLQNSIQVETADIENVLERRVAKMHLLDRRARIDLDQARFQLLLLPRADEVGLRQQDAPLGTNPGLPICSSPRARAGEFECWSS